MDGVLADFHDGVCRLYGITIQDCLEACPPPWNYAIEEQISAVLKKHVSGLDMWTLINRKMPGFWRHLRPYDHAKELYDCLGKKYGFDNIVISTSPGTNPQAFAEKVVWMEDFFCHSPMQMMVGPKKHLLADKNHVLIDDSVSNIRAFHNHGGKTVLVPQPWNGSEFFAEGLYRQHPTKFINSILTDVYNALNS